MKALGKVYGKSVAFDNYESKQKILNDIRYAEEHIIDNPDDTIAANKNCII